MITVGIVAAGCANQAPTHPAPSFPAGPIATVMPAGQAPPVAPTTSPAQPDVIANIPTAARMRTGPGAEAFVRYFFDVASEEDTKPRGGQILFLSAQTCKTCAAWNDMTLQLVRGGIHFTGPQIQLKAVNGMDGNPTSDETYRVAARVTDSAYPVVDQAGRLVKRVEPVDGTLVIYLKWTIDQWSVSEIKVLLTGEKR